METLATQVLICSLLTTLVFLSCPAMSQEVIKKGDAVKHDYAIEKNDAEFNYDMRSKKGPFHWGEIKPEWSQCQKGSMQSPIHLTNETIKIVSELGPLQVNYTARSHTTVVNKGHQIMLKWNESTNFLHINGTQYLLKTSHWHSPSEHTLNGKRLDLEVHMVHESPSGQTAVIGTLYRVGEFPDALIDLVIHHLKDIPHIGDEMDVGPLDPNPMIKDVNSYYRYMGSLTTPPCTQNVLWTLFKEVGTVTPEQLELLRKHLRHDSKANARPTQPLNNRLVELNQPKNTTSDKN